MLSATISVVVKGRNYCFCFGLGGGISSDDLGSCYFAVCNIEFPAYGTVGKTELCKTCWLHAHDKIWGDRFILKHVEDRMNKMADMW